MSGELITNPPERSYVLEIPDRMGSEKIEKFQNSLRDIEQRNNNFIITGYFTDLRTACVFEPNFTAEIERNYRLIAFVYDNRDVAVASVSKSEDVCSLIKSIDEEQMIYIISDTPQEDI